MRDFKITTFFNSVADSVTKIEKFSLAFFKFITVNNIKQKELAEFLGIGKAQVSAIVNGRVPTPEKHILRILTNNRGWDTSMLKGGAPAKAQPTPAEIVLPRLLPSDIVSQREINLYEWYQDNSEDAEHVDVSKLVHGSDFAVRVKSDMMYPHIKPDDIIYVQKLEEDEKIFENTCYFIDTNVGSLVGFMHFENGKILCSGMTGKNVVTLNENEVYGVYRITSRISNYPVRKDDQNIKSLFAQLDSSNKRTDRLLDDLAKANQRVDRALDELAKAGERMDRTLELVTQLCAKIGN